MDNATEALLVARQAMEIAQQSRSSVDVVTAFTKTVGDSMNNLVSDVRAMRAENTQQHSEGRAFMHDNFEKVHTRISTVAAKQDDIRSELVRKIDEVKKESAEGDKEIITSAARRREKVLQALIWVLVAVILAFIGKETGLQINLPFN